METEEEKIRRPDAVITDRLFSNTEIPQYKSKYVYDDDYVKRILEESEADFEFQFAILESKRIAKEREEREKHFAGFLSKIKQFAKIDKSNESFYSELIKYIELYEIGEVETIPVHRDFYMKFANTLDNMRIHPDEKSRLYQFIQLVEIR
jgi:hypothetical protein